MRSADECEMSRSCQSATFSIATCACPRTTLASPLIRSLTTGLRLWGMALEPFCPSAKGSCDLSHLRASEMTDLGRDAIERRGGHRERRHVLGMSIALDDLGARILGPQAESRTDQLLDPRVDRGVGADHPADRPDAHRLAGAPEPLTVAIELEGHHRELVSERRRLGMHAVRSADHGRVAIGERPPLHHGEQAVRAARAADRRRLAAAARTRYRARPTTSSRSGSIDPRDRSTQQPHRRTQRCRAAWSPRVRRRPRP